MFFLDAFTARKTIYPKSWNFMKSSKRPRKYQLSVNFLDKKRPYFLSLKSSKQELFLTQKTWYSMLKKLSSYINFLNQKKTVFAISEKLKTKTFQYSENMVVRAQENVILYHFFESNEDHIFHLGKVQHKNFSVSRKNGASCWRKGHLTSTFWIKRRPYQEIFRIQKTWYSMLKKISSPISEKLKASTFP